MTKLSVQQILGGKAPADQPVTVKGWVRTRRDSKAGISFVNISDGSCFHPVQVVAPATLANYAVEIAHLTAGCAVEATGIIVPSPAKGQPFEMQASAVNGVARRVGTPWQGQAMASRPRWAAAWSRCRWVMRGCWSSRWPHWSDRRSVV